MRRSWRDLGSGIHKFCTSWVFPLSRVRDFGYLGNYSHLQISQGAVEKSMQGKWDIPSISTAQSRDQFLPVRFPRSHISGLGFIGSMENGFAFSRGTGKGRRSQPRLPINPGAPGGREFPTGNSLPIVPAPKPATA